MHESKLSRVNPGRSEARDEDELRIDGDSWDATAPNVDDEPWLDEDSWLDEDPWLDNGLSTVSVDSLGRVHISLA